MIFYNTQIGENDEKKINDDYRMKGKKATEFF